MKEERVSDYKKAEAFLAEVPKFTKKNPLEETKGFYQFIQECDNGIFSEKRLGKIIHVAGTNGKGSVCSFIQQICIESGYKTAMFTSPHLVTTRERFCINGEMISEEIFLEAYNWLIDKINEYNIINLDYKPTYFERLFFMGIYIFSRSEAEVTILETGLGGRLDTTNVINSPVISVITEVGFDHTEYLGETLEQIAGEKAGIIKPEIPVVFSDRKREVSTILTQKAKECGSKCYKISKKEYKINENRKKFIDFSLSNLYYDYGRFIVNSQALYQIENAAIAVKTCDVLLYMGMLDRLTTESVKNGISKMKWPGRMEEIVSEVYIDGAHNVDGIEAFVNTVNNMDFTNINKVILIFSSVRDKRYQDMIQMLCNIPVVTDFVITQIPGERGTALNELVENFRLHTNKDIHSFEDIKTAIEFAIADRGDKGRVYVVGSLYLAGIIQEIIKS